VTVACPAHRCARYCQLNCQQNPASCRIDRSGTRQIPHLTRKLRQDVVIRVPRDTHDKREVGGGAALACGVFAALNGAANLPGPISKDVLLYESCAVAMAGGVPRHLSATDTLADNFQALDRESPIDLLGPGTLL